jgi:hypothetical protein
MRSNTTTTAAKVLGLATAVILTLTLAACGPDDSTPAAAPTTSPTTMPTTTASSAGTTPTPTDVAGPVPRREPSVPYILGGVLHVDGTTVQGGPFWQVHSGPKAWIAVDTSGHWWWGRHAEAMRIESSIDDVPAISANGKYVGLTSLPNGITGFDTGFSGEGLGGHELDLGNRQNGTQVTVRAVTDDGMVIAQGGDTGVMWRPLADQKLVDLTTTAPDQEVIAGTAGGLVVTDGPADADGPAYLASIGEDGTLTKLGDLPDSDSLITSPDGQNVVYTPAGTLGGEVTTVSTLNAQRLDGTGSTTLRLPKGWDFEVANWSFEDDTYLVAVVNDGRGEALARCRVADGTCVVWRSDDAVQPASFTGRWLVQGGQLVIKDDHSARASHATDCPDAWGGASDCTQEIRLKWTEEGKALRLLVLDVWVTDGTRKQFPDPAPPMSAGSFYLMTLNDDGSATTRLQNDDGAVSGANGLGNPYLCRPGSEALSNGVCD